MTTSTPATIRLAHPLAFCSYLRHVGADPHAYLRRSGLPTMCDDPHAIVTLDRAWTLFAEATCREDEDFGWFVGQFAGDQQLNIALLRQLEKQPTLHRALQFFIAKVSSESSQLRLRLVEYKTDVLLCTSYKERRGIPGYHGSQGYQLEAYIDLIRHFLGRDWNPPLIGMEADSVNPAIRERHGSSRMLFGQNCGFISIPRLGLTRSATYRHDASGEPSDLLYTDAMEFQDALRHMLRPYLRERRVDARFAADLMVVSLRTQGRRLEELGTSFQHVIDKLRLEIARDLLDDGEMLIGDIGAEVGFNDQAHFTRLFRRLTGLSPREYLQLQNHRAQDQGTGVAPYGGYA